MIIRKEDLVKVLFCMLVVEYRNMAEGLFRALLTFQTKNVILMRYWNNGINSLNATMDITLRTIEIILNEFIPKVYHGLKIEMLDDIEDFNNKMDIVVEDCKYSQILADSGCLKDGIIPRDEELEEGVTITPFLTHLHFIHYCEVIDKYYPHLIADTNTEDLFLSLSMMSDRYFTEMWKDINLMSIEILKERGTVN